MVSRKAILREFPKEVDPSLVDERVNGNGFVVGFLGVSDFDFLVVKVGESVGAYLEEEVSKADEEPEEINFDWITSHALDGAVHDEVSKMGSSINNEGRLSQIRFLKERGWSNADFSRILKKPKNIRTRKRKK